MCTVMATPAANFTADNFPRVKVLYNYDYQDDMEEKRVWMEVGEVFYLLNSDQEEWWQVCRPDSPKSPFYVPSTYVEVLSNVSGTSHQGQVGNNVNIQTHSILNDTVRKNMMSTFKGISCDEEESDYVNAPDMEAVNSDTKDIKVQYISSSDSRPSNLEVEDDYVNLEQFRELAGMPTLASTESQTPPSPETPEAESDYANLQQLNMTDTNTPDIANCEFLKTLQDTWDVYRDPLSNRLFYVNKISNETQWKPPRGQYHEELHKKAKTDMMKRFPFLRYFFRSCSSGEYEDVILPTSRGNRKSHSIDCGKPLIFIDTNVPEGWTSVKDNGEDVFINNATKQEWYRAYDTQGRSYYYRQSKEVMHSVWQLPRSGGSSPTKSPSSDTDGKPDFSATQGLVQGPRPGDRSQVSERFAKSRSVMIENLHFNAPPISIGPPPPKSATLPPNFATPNNEDLSIDGMGNRKPQMISNHHQSTVFHSVFINEPIEGWLNKCKFTNGKKPSKKWAMTYVKLGGSNLVFYKDQKSSQGKQGQPFGKYDQLVSLATCHVDKDTEKFTSKKNTIGLTCPDCQILLQANDEIEMQKWFVKIHTRIQELGGSPDGGDSVSSTNTDLLTPETEKVTRKPSFKDKSHSRKQSDSGNLERKGKIKNVLERFMTNRSDKEKLIKKGIYKDAVFGADIKQICAKEKTKVPMFVVRSIEAIEKRGLDHEGIYRIGGNISQIQKLRCMVDQGEQYYLDDPLWDVHVLTGALKLFFRELKDPLFTSALFDKFLKSFLNEKASERLKGMKATIEELPKPNYDTIKLLFKHLSNVIDQCKENKMAAHQLAIVFGPTLIWPEVQHQNLATSMVYQSRIVEYILLEYKNIFR